jgi:hypothetical protein
VGREIPKEYREIVAEIVANQGWRYDASRGVIQWCSLPIRVSGVFRCRRRQGARDSCVGSPIRFGRQEASGLRKRGREEASRD